MTRRALILHHRASGFTLVELLLAITMMSLLLALAYGGMRAATRATESGQAQLEESSRLRITHQFIRRQFSLMLPLPYMVEADGPDEELRQVMTGTPESIQFVGPMPGYLGTGGPQVQYIELEPGENGMALTFRHAVLENFEPDNLFLRDPVVLLDGLESVHFEYLEPAEAVGVRANLRDNESAADLAEGEVAGQWVADWQMIDTLPLLVRMDVVYADGAKVSWPTLYASPRLDPLAVGGAESRQDYQDIIRDMIRRRGGDQD
ncbi:prepilin-type N-terminal cleavage/methylation domain-containing protein [Marinihelvus fidelis]|uniref:Prepilin-type N-terminal cleavage/methylation domain-containing protein n=1 Tax=Marinihelvus fidelis TaxID=2613842 RepID=A0A5N0T7L6_9GAMM|nr:prepilin-type N-terminal cleavage/methylation domain-containing protein [Marinihelvus fidelis]KAA9130771.1 prepilin-type N-terminal cleavage/methylation domain-containing protein [Marinihelvus fidelis]